jgi:hypothetical protein
MGIIGHLSVFTELLISTRLAEKLVTNKLLNVSGYVDVLAAIIDRHRLLQWLQNHLPTTNIMTSFKS